MSTVSSHQQAAFTSPVNGTSPIDADEVRLNDNGIRATYNSHDSDATIHIQSSTLALQPVAGTAGRVWLTTDTGNLRTWFDTGAEWLEVGNDHLNLRVRATETIAKGDVLKAAGWNVGAGALDVAKVASSADVAIGLARTAIANGALGYVVNTGTLTGLNTNAFNEGDTLYPDTSGGLTATKPTSGSYQAIAFVVRKDNTNGVLLIEATEPVIVQTPLNTAGTMVQRDGSGNFAAGTITATFSGNLTGNVTGNVTGDVSGNAGTATKLSSARTFALSGDVTGSVSSDLTAGASIAATYAGTVPINKGGTNLTATPTNGQVLIGNGSGYTLATLTAGSNINITNSAGGITIEAVLGGGSVSGSGTVDFVPRWTGTTSVGDSTIRDDGTDVGIGGAIESGVKAKIHGAARVTGNAQVDGALTVVGGTTLNTVPYTWPSASGAAGTVLTNNGSGGLNWSYSSPPDTLVAANYSVAPADANTRLVINTTSTPDVLFADPAIATGSRVGLFARNGAATLQRNVLSAVNPNANSEVWVTVLQSDGKLIIGGAFTTVGGITRNRIARLNTDGTLDTGYNPNLNSLLYGAALQSDGKLIIGGSFTTVGGTTSNYIARLNTDGTLDGTFTVGTGFNNVPLQIAVQSDDKSVVVGLFTDYNGTTRNRMARLNTDGTLDTGYNPNLNSTAASVFFQADGKAIIASGTFGFTTVGGVSRPYIARINTDGTLDTGFNATASANVNIGRPLSDGRIFAAGSFTTIGGATRPYMAILQSNGTADTSFNANVTFTAGTSGPFYAVQELGESLLIGGAFTMEFNGTARNHLVSLSLQGVLNGAFPFQAPASVRAFPLWQAGTRLAIVGAFTSLTFIGGGSTATRNRIADITAPDAIFSPYPFTPTLAQYSNVTLEKVAARSWVIIESNVS